MSEFNDFDRRPDAGTFRSCFEAIETCDYYLLFVGDRKGSWYDDQETISVTQQEFRVAADLANAGKIIVIPFIRSEALAVVRERAAIAPTNEFEAAASSPSAYFRQDTTFMSRFISEIRQRQVGTSDTGQSPEYLWSYPFTEFAQIIDTLKVTLNLHHPIRRQSLLANLKWEILDNFGVLAVNTEDGPAFAHAAVRKLREAVDLNTSKLESTTEIDKKNASRLLILLVCIPRVGQLRKSAIETALHSGEFLEYDVDAKTTMFTGTYRVLQQLLHEIERLDISIQILDEHRIPLLARISAFNETVQLLQHGTMSVDNRDLLTVFTIQDRLESITDLSIVLYSVVSGFFDDAFIPPLPPTTPLIDQVRDIEKEHFSHQKAEEWLEAHEDEAKRILQDWVGNSSAETSLNKLKKN